MKFRLLKQGLQSIKKCTQKVKDWERVSAICHINDKAELETPKNVKFLWGLRVRKFSPRRPERGSKAKFRTPRVQKSLLDVSSLEIVPTNDLIKIAFRKFIIWDTNEFPMHNLVILFIIMPISIYLQMYGMFYKRSSENGVLSQRRSKIRVPSQRTSD